jgi:hypothetical protein
VPQNVPGARKRVAHFCTNALGVLGAKCRIGSNIGHLCSLGTETSASEHERGGEKRRALGVRIIGQSSRRSRPCLGF